jgi:hypothetical protein
VQSECNIISAKNDELFGRYDRRPTGDPATERGLEDLGWDDLPADRRVLLRSLALTTALHANRVLGWVRHPLPAAGRVVGAELLSYGHPIAHEGQRLGNLIGL